MLRDVLSINFSSFSIGRYLEARAGDAAMLDLLKPTAPFQRRRKMFGAAQPIGSAAAQAGSAGAVSPRGEDAKPEAHANEPGPKARDPSPSTIMAAGS